MVDVDDDDDDDGQEPDNFQIIPQLVKLRVECQSQPDAPNYGYKTARNCQAIDFYDFSSILFYFDLRGDDA